jgi:catechol 2,3-dioxygenase
MISNSLPSDTHIAGVHLRVADLQRSADFYSGILGFRLISRENGSLAFSATGSPPGLVLFSERPGAVPKPVRATGLFHVAIRLPDRKSLARIFQQLLQHKVQLQGASDHKVSEALYLADPDGNGLELYVDRPREQWPVFEGQVAMTTDRLEISSLLAEIRDDREPWEGIAPGTDIGHIHLQVSDLSQAEAFYHGLIGLDVTQRSYPGALFLSAGGYHHHVGVNIWNSRGAPPPPADAAGLVSFRIRVPDPPAWEALVKRIEDASLPIEERMESPELADILVRDPSQNAVELVTDRLPVPKPYPPAG